MNFSSETDNIIKPFINSFGICETQKLSKENNKEYNSIIISLYNDIYKANETIFNDGCFKSKLVHMASNKDDIKVPNDKNTRYFPAPIQKYIDDNEKYQLIFSCGNVGQREITIIFTLFSEEELKQVAFYTEYVRMMYIWLHICASHADKHCTETLNIFIYPTPFTKNLPTSPSTVIGPNHINTAFTVACVKNGQIIIYRQEEWFKVFIHETFHTYGLDFATTHNTSLKHVIQTIFPINSDFNMYEAYTETWARIINCAFCSFNSLDNKKNKKDFIVNLNFCLEIERMFSLSQCIKILGFMGLQYKNLYITANNNQLSDAYMRQLYKENTNVFSYYIMTAIFLNDHHGFMLWCKKNNTSLLKFRDVSESFELFSVYIKSIYDCPPLLNNIARISELNNKNNKKRNKNNKNKLNDTTRMTIIHTI